MDVCGSQHQRPHGRLSPRRKRPLPPAPKAATWSLGRLSTLQRTIQVASVALQRCDGLAELRISACHGISRIARLHQAFPCRLLFPNTAAGEPPLAVWTTLSGGLAGGDRLRLQIVVDSGAALSVTSQAAERVYRSNGMDCIVDVNITIGADAWLDWAPRATILFDGARLRRRTTISIAPGGRLLACEGFTFGRLARGESFTSGLLFDRWRIDRGGRPLWIDSLRLDDPRSALAAPAAFDGSRALATALYVAEDAEQYLDAARELLNGSQARAGATVVNDVLVARFLGREPDQVHRDLSRYLAALRQRVGPYSANLPRIGND